MACSLSHVLARAMLRRSCPELLVKKRIEVKAAFAQRCGDLDVANAGAEQHRPLHGVSFLRIPLIVPAALVLDHRHGPPLAVHHEEVGPLAIDPTFSK